MAHVIIHHKLPEISQIAEIIGFSYFTPHAEHPDVKIIGHDAGTSIGIQEVREFIAWVGLRPFQEAAKLGIIANAHLLTEQAQNSLLKTLEEHNRQTYITLVANHTGLLLPTVLSRVINHRLNRVEEEKVDLTTAEYFLRGDYWQRAELLATFQSASTTNRVGLEEFLQTLMKFCVSQVARGSETLVSILESLELLVISNQNNVNYKLLLQNLQIIPRLL